MFKLDNAFLEELGLGSLPPVEKNKMLAHIYETLEMRVGMKLAEKMSNEQLDEFESYIKQKDEAGALKWLESNFPDYKQVVAQELEKLKGEIAQVAPQIVSQFAVAGQGQQQQTVQQQSAPPIQTQSADPNQMTQTPSPQQQYQPAQQPMQQPVYPPQVNQPQQSFPAQPSPQFSNPTPQQFTQQPPVTQVQPSVSPPQSQQTQQPASDDSNQSQPSNYTAPVIPAKPWQPEQ